MDRSRRQTVEWVRYVGEHAPVARPDAEKEDEPAFDERDMRRLEVERIVQSKVIERPGLREGRAVEGDAERVPDPAVRAVCADVAVTPALSWASASNVTLRSGWIPRAASASVRIASVRA